MSEEMNLTLDEDTLDTDGQPTYLGVLSTNSEYLLAIISVFISATAILGSSFMIYTVVASRKRCGIRMIFYLSLLVGNTAQAAFTMPFAIYFIIAYRVPLSIHKDVTKMSESSDMAYLTFCNISGFVYNVTRLTTLWFVCAITLDRFLFVCLPFKAQHVTKMTYNVFSFVIWAFSCGVSVSPYLFGKIYRHYERDIMVCSFILQDIVPSSLHNIDLHGNSSVDFSVLLGYYFSLIIFPICFPLCLILMLTVVVCIELTRIHAKKAVPSVRTEKVSFLKRLSRSIKNDSEIRLTLVMICTSLSYIVCYSLWFFSLFLNIAILFKWASPNWLYITENIPEPISGPIVQLFKICETTGFIHTAFEPIILYTLLIKPTRKSTIRRMNKPV